MHPEFQKWGLMGPWFSKNGAHATKCAFESICHLLNKINRTFKYRDIWSQVIAKIAGTSNILRKKPQGRFECIPVYTHHSRVIIESILEMAIVFVPMHVALVNLYELYFIFGLDLQVLRPPSLTMGITRCRHTNVHV